MIYFKQLNCARRRGSTLSSSTWNKCDIALLQEPNHITLRDLQAHGAVFKTPACRSAIFIKGPLRNKGAIDCTLIPQFSNRDFITIQIEQQNTYICSAYFDRSVRALHSWPKIIDDLTAHCKSKNIRLIIGADANAHGAMWNSTSQDSRADAIEQAIMRHDLYVHNIGDTPTFDPANGRGTALGTIIDITMSTDPTCITGWKVSDEISQSDHRVIEFELDNVCKADIVLSRNLKKVDWSNVARDLRAAVPFKIPQAWSKQTLDEASNDLAKALEASLDAHAPKKPPARRFNYWWNDECTFTKLQCHRTERTARRHPTAQKKEKQRIARTAYNKAICRAKESSWREFIKEIDSLPDMAKVNKIMRSTGGPAVELGLVKKQDGSLTESKQEALNEMLGEHFPGSGPQAPDEPYDNTWAFLEDRDWLTKNRYHSAVAAFKKGKAPGPDEFRAECLKKLDSITIDYILTLFNASITLKYVPHSWRQVKVIFIPKPGKPDYAERRSFRPISLMSVLFKTLERLVLWHIEEVVLKDKPMHKNQFGFRKGKSTEHALSKAVNFIEKGMNQGNYVLGVFCDISGAFDNVELSSITDAMRKRGIDETITRWYDHFLRYRTATSSLGSVSASIRPGKGIPQGGVLSAILGWNLVFDDFLHLFDNSPICSIGFADDGTLLISGFHLPEMYKAMQRALNNAQFWAEQNGLKFCPNKTNAIIFTRTHLNLESLPKLNMNGVPIPQVTETKMLGVLLDSKLNWSPHINNRLASCRKALMMLRPILGRTWSPKPKYTKWLYTGVILPMFTYGCHVWASGLDTDTMKAKLNKLQRLGLTSITSVRKGTPTAGLEIIYNTPPIHLLVEERALNTFIRLGPLKDVVWQADSKYIQFKGHLKRLRDKIPSEAPADTDEISPVANLEPTYIVDIEPNQPPRTENYSIYTDGSLLNHQSGAGAYILENGIPRICLSERLPLCSVFQSELAAINLACSYIFSQQSDTLACHFHVDSQAALKALTSPYITSDSVLFTKNLLEELSKSHLVTLQWIKAHVGLPGNEQADVAAKSGSKSNREYTGAIKTSKTQTKNLIRDARNLHWEREWVNADDCRQSKLFMPAPNKEIWADLRSLGSSKLSRVVRFLTGHTFMNRHKVLINTKSYYAADEHLDAQCRLCEEEPETPEHLITECPVLNDHRMATLQHWQLPAPPAWTKDIISFIQTTEIIALEARS
jgi:ribonuclease HI